MGYSPHIIFNYSQKILDKLLAPYYIGGVMCRGHKLFRFTRCLVVEGEMPV